VSVLSDVVVKFLNSFVVRTANKKIWIVPLLHSMNDNHKAACYIYLRDTSRTLFLEYPKDEGRKLFRNVGNNRDDAILQNNISANTVVRNRN
jgi:hypothetical protein